MWEPLDKIPLWGKILLAIGLVGGACLFFPYILAFLAAFVMLMAALNGTSTAWYCPKCGKQVGWSGVKTCPRCGHQLEE